VFIMCTSNRILIVDDDPRTLARYRRALQSAGYAVDEAEGEEAALEKFRRSKSDLVLLARRCTCCCRMRNRTRTGKYRPDR
jgi:DNA-binding response OmpR family regulator